MRSIDEIISGSQPRPVVIAHRGASFYHHENTMEAFKAAVEMQSEMMELDVRCTQDGELVVHHDPEMGEAHISEMFLEEVLKTAAREEYEIPVLEEVLQYGKDKVPIDIELKETGYEEKALEAILDILDPAHFIITSVYDHTIRKIKDLRPDIKTGLIISSHPRWQLMTKLYPQRRARQAGADVLVVSQKLLKVGFLSTAGSIGLPIWIYTVNERKELWRMITDERVAGIFTDRPDVALFLRDLYAVAQSKQMPPSIKVQE